MPVFEHKDVSDVKPSKKITWNNFGKGRGYTLFTHILIKIDEQQLS